MQKHSVIFCGTPDFAVPSLQALIDEDAFNVLAVITQPDKPVGRKQLLTAPAVKILAEKNGIPVFQPENINIDLPAHIASGAVPRPDFLIVVAYGKILKQNVLDIPTIAPINVHGSILPRWRGASPVEHAILAGDTTTGVTVQIMSAGLDEGPILSMQNIALEPRITSTELRAALSNIGAQLLVDTLKKPLDPKPQPETGVTVCKKLTREDGAVDTTTMTATEIDRRVRALNPWPSVRCMVHGHELKIIASSLVEASASIAIPCARGSTIYLVTVQEAGKKAMNAADWLRGVKKD
jgi:methionyl-tRNA formyltransferase